MNTLLVVCIGNICRSPMAQGVLAAALPQWRVQSAGLGAVVGAPADEIAVRLLKERGLDIAGHRGVQLTRKMVLDANLVFVMDQDQRRHIEKIYPEACGRVYRLAEHADRDIPDPHRQPEPAFRQALQFIDEGVARWVPRIQRL